MNEAVLEIQRILCPIDYSVFSRHALDHAVAIARWYKSTITLFHVTSIVPSIPYSPAGVIVPPLPVTSDDRARMLEALERFAETEAGFSVPMEFAIGEGTAAVEILAKAGAMRADLVVLGTHGLSGFDRLMLGSVTEKVLRKASCPVLTVPSQAPDAVPVPSALFRRILCAVDFSNCSMRALDYAMSLAKEGDGHLTVLNVLELPPGTPVDLDEASMAIPRGLRAYVESTEADRQTRLAAAVPDQVRTFCTVETILAEGTPYREILRVARQQPTNLIVLGVRGRGPVDLMFFGSTTQHVVRQATCPVLTLRTC